MRVFHIALLIIGTLAVAACASLNNNANNDRSLGSGQGTNQIALANIQLGIAYLESGKYEKSLEKLELAKKADPDYAITYNLLGLLYQNIREYSKAEKNFKHALRKDANNPSILNNYGQFLCQQKQFSKSEKIFLRAAENPLYETPEIAYTNAGICVQKSGNEVKAENFYRKALEFNPNIPQALIRMSELTMQQNNYALARKYLQKYQDVARHNPKSLWLGIQIEEILGNKDAVSSYGLLLSNEFSDSTEAAQYKELRGN